MRIVQAVSLNISRGTHRVQYTVAATSSAKVEQLIGQFGLLLPSTIYLRLSELSLLLTNY